MSSFLEVRLADDQLDALADRIARKMAKGQTLNKPLSISDAAKALGVSDATVRRRIEAGLIRTVQGIGVPRVSQAEIRRLLGDPETSPE